MEIPTSVCSSLLLHFDFRGGLSSLGEICFLLDGLPRFLGTDKAELILFPFFVEMDPDVDATSPTGTTDSFFGGRPRRLGAKYTMNTFFFHKNMNTPADSILSSSCLCFL